MEPPDELLDRMNSLSAACGVTFQITRFWPNEFRPGWYCRFQGAVHESPLLTIHLAGSLTINLTGERQDEVEVFLFANGERLGKLDNPYEYLHRRGEAAFHWADLDEAFRVQRTLKSIAMLDNGWIA